MSTFLDLPVHGMSGDSIYRSARPLASIRKPAGRAVSGPSVVLLAWRLPIMLITLLLFLFSAVTIYLACEYFVNGIEWTGHHFK